jgi:predicted ATPase
MQDQTAAGLAQLCRGLADLLATSAVIYQPLCLLLLAEFHGRADQIEAGLQALSEAFAIIGEAAQSYMAAELYRLHGELLLRQPPHDAAQAERRFQHALDLARRQQANAWELRAAMSLARLCCRQGKQARAYRVLEPVDSRFMQGFDTADLQEARAILSDLQASVVI